MGRKAKAKRPKLEIAPEEKQHVAAAAAGPGPSSGGRAPAWVDPADAALRIDLASRPRLRKLRADKGQTEVSGAVYEAALRRQHSVIYGAASWAALPAARAGAAATATADGPGTKSLESFAVLNREDNPLLAFLGDGGHIGLVSLRGRQAAGSVKLNGSARAAAFTDDGLQLLAAGGDGVVSAWDLRTRRCLGTLRDEGSVGATALAVSGGAAGGWLAAGSGSGVVNLYRRGEGGAFGGGGGGLDGGAAPGGRGLFAAAPEAAKPFRSLMHLTTSIDTLTFSRDGQMLLMGSRLKKDAMRVVHLPSGTVFSNFPPRGAPLHYAHCAAFSPGGGYLAAGNAKGRVLLWRLHHYGAA